MLEMFKPLTWFRLQVTFKNIRLINPARAFAYEVIQAIIKGVTISIEGSYDPGTSPVFFHIKGKGYNFKLHRFVDVPVEVFFCRKDAGYVRRWRDALKCYLADPTTGRNFEIVDTGEIEERSFDRVAVGFELTKTAGEICLGFLTPFPFKAGEGKKRTHISRDGFIKSFERRFSRLFGVDIAYESGDDDFSLLPYYWNYTEMRHPSHSQPGHAQYINGCVGRLYIKGSFKGILPFLILGSELHTGTKLSNAQGYYLLQLDPPGYFDRYFPDRGAILSSIRDVVARYDSAIESLSEVGGLPFKEEVFADDLERQIRDGTYTPSPAIAFTIKKKGGVERRVEQLHFKDLIVAQYLLKTITKVFDRFFEEESIGFRRGISREQAIEVVQSAIREGYQYVIESDIEDFFPSIDLHTLWQLLDFYIPTKDRHLRDTLLKFIRNGYILNGTLYQRVKGLAQGSPLSPILANLYLDSFDEMIKGRGVRMVRYADDFIILTRSKEEAGDVLSTTESYLSQLGLKIKKEKTAIRPIREGFHFLGIRFERSEVRVEPEDEIKRLRKPLYITEPYLFLALNGEAIDIKRDRAVIETIPLRRISEIMVMERSSLSTGLIARCIEFGIPISITLNTGYYITTVKPDSKRYYDISFQHGRRYASLSDTEILFIAKGFAGSKLKNYIALFRQKYKKGLNPFIRDMEGFVGRIDEADGVDGVRGVEGAAMKRVYQELNHLIDDEAFHIKKRDRKRPDRINSLLNFGYYLLFSRINATVRAVGLNPYLGFLHSPLDNYESLVCDIQEPFRARIDRFIIRLINLKVIRRDDFLETGEGFYLKKDAVKRFVNHFEGEMERKKGNTISLKETIYVQINIVKRWVMEEGSLSFYTWET